MNLEQKKITKEVAETMGIKFSEVMGRRRFQNIVNARWWSWYALRLRDYTYTELAQVWGVNHTAIVHAVHQIRERLSINDRETIKDMKLIAPLLESAGERYRYHVSLSGEVIITSREELQPASIREKALTAAECGACEFTTHTTKKGKLAVAA